VKIKFLFQSTDFITDSSSDISFGKGYRGDIVVIVDKNYYELSFYEPTRLNQDIHNEDEVFAIPNLIVIPAITLNYMIKAVEYLHRQSYFDNIKKSTSSRFKNYKEVDLSV
jgi:signal peptidase I